MKITRSSLDAAVARYRELCAAGTLHWSAVERAAAEYGLPADVLHHQLSFEAGRLTALGRGV